MVDNRSAGFYGIGGGFNFKSGDISGTAANTQHDKMGPGTEYGAIPQKEEEQAPIDVPFVDRSAQLRATLNSLAMMNVANVLTNKRRADIISDDEKEEEQNKGKDEEKELDEEFLNDLDESFLEDDENEYY